MRKMIDAIRSTYPGLLLNFLLLLAFILVDSFWLNSLARWRISYGPVRLPFLLFSFLRLGLFILLLILLALAHRVTPAFRITSLVSLLGLNLVLLGLAVYGFCIEPFRLTQTHLTVQVPGLSKPVRMVQLSDIHIEYTTRREEAIPPLVESLKPDLVVLTGDYTSESLTNNANTMGNLHILLKQLVAIAPLGVYAVNGNAEFPEVMDMLLVGTGVQTLHNQVVRIPELGEHTALLGLDYDDWFHDERNLKALMDQVQPDDYTILLYHKPDLAYEAESLKVNLYLAGHTHGGQVRLPWIGAIFTNSRYGKTFEMGTYTLDKTTLFISRGLGFTGGNAPRVRFLAPPEVVVIDLVPAP